MNSEKGFTFLELIVVIVIISIVSVTATYNIKDYILNRKRTLIKSTIETSVTLSKRIAKAKLKDITIEFDDTNRIQITDHKDLYLDKGVTVAAKTIVSNKKGIFQVPESGETIDITNGSNTYQLTVYQNGDVK